MYVESILTASVNQTGLGLSRALATTYVALWKASGPNCIKISVDRAMDECNGVSSIGGVLQSSVGKPPCDTRSCISSHQPDQSLYALLCSPTQIHR
ncbi:hypothetical protein V6N11_051342 [Hibiscus sabdariffa]|uniref:Uncharacterized protein n=1 Tax=Hibiscus sabdariffa TaxID=183260 RepID=A0ABR2AA73_9ROSI